jgi:hypothetical protein
MACTSRFNRDLGAIQPRAYHFSPRLRILPVIGRSLDRIMSWPIRFVENPPIRPRDPEYPLYGGEVDFDQMVVGDLCFYHTDGKPCLDQDRLRKMHLTAHYFAHNASRPPLILALPDKAAPNGKLYFLVDGQCYSDKCTKCGNGRRKCKCGDARTPKGYYDGWTVAGKPPLITVSPSVNYDDDEYGIKHYHGFIRDGVIGDG